MDGIEVTCVLSLATVKTVHVQVDEQPLKAFKEGRVASIPLIMVRTSIIVVLHHVV